MHNNPNAELLSQCAWCRRMLIENEYRLASPLPGFRVSHGICPDCVPILLKDIPGGAHGVTRPTTIPTTPNQHAA